MECGLNFYTLLHGRAAYKCLFNQHMNTDARYTRAGYARRSRLNCTNAPHSGAIVTMQVVSGTVVDGKEEGVHE